MGSPETKTMEEYAKEGEALPKADGETKQETPAPENVNPHKQEGA